MRSRSAVVKVTKLFCLVATLAFPLTVRAAEVHPIESEIRRSFPSVSMESNMTFEAADTFVAGQLVGGVRARVASSSKDKFHAGDARAVLTAPSEMVLNVLHPRSYDGMIVAEAGAQRVVLRAIGTAGASASESNGKLVYTRPFPSTDIVEVPRGNRSEELLLLHDQRAPLTYEYEIVAAEGVAGVTIDNGAIRFLPKVVSTEPVTQTGAHFARPAPWLQIDRPWLIDSWGKRSESHAQWSLVGEGAIPQRIRLTITPERLAYPLLVDPSFSVGGSLGTGRSDATATLLLNGKVLIVGGYNSGALSSAELYDPATGTFTATTGGLTTGREFHTATLLPNGKVLIAGGVGTSGILPSCELYDPATGTFTVTASLSAARVHHSATLLPNGKVLIAGGSADYPGASPLASAELFDPAGGTNGSFTATGSLTVARRRHTATLLPNGKVLIAGGMGSTASTTIAVTELFDPGAGTNGTFTESANLGTARYYHTATLLATGKVLIAGGTSDGTNGLTSGEIYDPGTNTVGGTKGSLATARWIHSATLLPNGTVLLVAGTSNGSNYLASAEVFDPGTSLFTTSAASLATGRIAHTATLLPGGQVLVAAGYNGTRLVSAEVYDAGAGAFTSTAFLATARESHTATLLPNGNVLIAGGWGGFNNYLASTEMYSSSTGLFAAAGSLTSGRSNHTATLLPSGKVLVTGGLNYVAGNVVVLASAELYDPSTNTFTATGTMATPRSSHTATLLTNGKVLVAGGYYGSALGSAEVYDPPTGTFTLTTGAMSNSRYAHTATLLPNGKVLVAGGHGTQSASAELYDPSAGTFSPTSNNLTSGREYHQATLLPNGKVLISGGSNGTTELSSAELYNPSTNTFAATGSLATGRFSHQSTLLPNGKVLISGGRSTGADFTSAELYDPSTSTFSTTGSLAVTHWSHQSTLLPNGKVLITGGEPLTTTSEIFDAGAGFSDARRPAITTAPSDVALPGTLTLTGSNFRGDSEASSGQTDGSPTNYPIVQLTRIDNEQTTVVTPSSNFSDTSWSASLSNLAGGWYRLTLFANAIPSVQQIVEIGTPDLTVTKSHTGTFSQGQPGATYTITVSNSGTGPTTGTVTVTDSLPAGMTATAIGGTGWTNCSITGAPSCTRSDALGAGSSYPPVTVTVSVALNAAASLSNTATVAGGGEITTSNDSATDTTTITPAMPDLTIGISHGSFTQGQSGATYTITATNSGFAATSGTVTVTATLPGDLTATAMSGSGWSCPTLPTCTRSDVLAAGSSYAAITLMVNVSTSAPASVNTSVAVSGGGEVTTSNDSAADNTAIAPAPDLTIGKTHWGNFIQGQPGATYTITVYNQGSIATSGTVSVTDTLPTGLTATGISGTNWTCDVNTLTCSRSDSLAALSSYPPITVTVTVANNAPATVTNVATVSGGGEANTTNDTASDPTTVLTPADLSISVSHSGNFIRGQMFRKYTITVSNTGPTATSSYTNVVDTLPQGLQLVTLGGSGWTCYGTFCQSVAVVQPGASFPPITLTVNVLQSAPASVTNSATVTGVSDLNSANNTALDQTTIAAAATCGGFAPAVNYPVPGAVGVKITDHNADGKPDLAVVSSGANTFVPLIGSGNGTFSASTPYQLSGTGSSIAVGDFDNNGFLDVVILYVNTSTTSNALFYGGTNGTGTFSSTVDAGAVGSTGRLYLGDFNGDSYPDVATPVASPGGDSISISQAQLNGPGISANSLFTFPVTGSPGALAMGDFNGDGKTDIAVIGTTGSSVLINEGPQGSNYGPFFGSGTPTPSIPLATGTGAHAVITADFNGDAILDLAIANRSTNDVSIYLGNGDGTFKTPTTTFAVGTSPYDLAAADFNGDGKLDLAVINNGSNNVSILFGNGDGTFGTAMNYPVGTAPTSIDVGDLNGDGRPDLVVTTSGNVAVLLSACPDLTISKSHSGTLTQGATGVNYSITAGNGTTAGAMLAPVTVTDTLPAALTTTAISGSGWTCTLANLTCTRSDALLGNASYPPITVTVNIASNAPPTVTNTATISGAGDTDLTNNTATDSAPVNVGPLVAPTNLVAIAASTTQANVSWDAVTVAAKYQVFRSSNNSSFALVATPTSPSFNDTGLTPGTTYVYEVKAVDTLNNSSSPTPNEIATTILFTDDPLVAGSTTVMAIHLTELRTAVNAVRAAAGLTAATFTDPSPAGVFIQAVHINELRTALTTARNALGLPAISYTDPSLTAGVTVKAAHLQEIRSGVK